MVVQFGRLCIGGFKCLLVGVLVCCLSNWFWFGVVCCLCFVWIVSCLMCCLGCTGLLVFGLYTCCLLIVYGFVLSFVLLVSVVLFVVLLLVFGFCCRCFCYLFGFNSVVYVILCCMIFCCLFLLVY